jgi:predicted Zn-dependent protease
MIVLILSVCEPAPAQAGGVNVPLASFASASSRVAAPGCDLLGSASQNFEQSNLKKQRAEYALGSRLAADVDEHNELVADDFIRQYVNHLEQKITGSSKLPGCFLVKVISNPEPNAYSLPGGFIYVTTGLIGAIDSEGELVATLAHETGHVTARHQTRIDAKTYIWGRLALVGGPAGYALRRYLGPLLIFKLVRDSEFEADRLGLRYQIAAGYDPLEFCRLLQIVFSDREEKESFLDRLYETHPPTDARIQRLQMLTPLFVAPQSSYIVDGNEFSEMKMRLAKVAAAQNDH